MQCRKTPGELQETMTGLEVVFSGPIPFCHLFEYPYALIACQSWLNSLRFKQ